VDFPVKHIKGPPLPPPATIGFLGGGQLERMTILAGRRMGYRFRVYAPGGNSPAGGVADVEIDGDFDDEEQLTLFADGLDAVICQFENIPARSMEFLSENLPVSPHPDVLRVCQNRRREKKFLSEKGFPLPAFRFVRSKNELFTAVKEIGRPCILKRAVFGYDGKGQYKIDMNTDLEDLWNDFKFPLGTVEEWVDYQGEYSVICARGVSGEDRVFPMIENQHVNNILHLSVVPARLSEAKQKEAKAIAEAITDTLGVIGLLTVEFFLTKDGRWLVNELAPRPHNSGHFSFDACATSQFEQHLRAICGIPLGDTRLLSPICMVNLLGDLWEKGQPNWNRVLQEPRARLHLYGKDEARKGRKMGHFCVLDEDVESALETARAIYQDLAQK